MMPAGDSDFQSESDGHSDCHHWQPLKFKYSGNAEPWRAPRARPVETDHDFRANLSWRVMMRVQARILPTNQLSPSARPSRHPPQAARATRAVPTAKTRRLLDRRRHVASRSSASVPILKPRVGARARPTQSNRLAHWQSSARGSRSGPHAQAAQRPRRAQGPRPASRGRLGGTRSF